VQGTIGRQLWIGPRAAWVRYVRASVLGTPMRPEAAGLVLSPTQPMDVDRAEAEGRLRGMLVELIGPAKMDED
jgi:hypothetical protein